jgi:hypothetical protein
MRFDRCGCSGAVLAAVASSMLALTACSGDSRAPAASGGGSGGAGDGSAPGGSGGAAAPAMMVACGDPNQPIDPTGIIDDMEDGNSGILDIGRRNGGWWAGGDATPGGSIVPSGTASPEMIPAGGRCGSRYAMRVTGQGFTDWGAVMTMSFVFGSVDGSAFQLQPYDASARTGITFWARVGDTSTNLVRFSVSDEHARPEAGICVVNGAPGMGCYDTFGVNLWRLSTTWTQYRIPFIGLTQRNFGVQADTVDTKNLYDVEFSFDANAIFDFWVDDIAFY